MYCGLLGRRLGHSYSPQIHSLLADYQYKLFEKEPEELEHFLLNENFTGLNVTIPYKKAVIPYCHKLTDRAKALGCVNTLLKLSDGTLIGHNSDYFGFETLVNKSGLLVASKKVLVHGSGGASVTAVAVLKELGADTVVISRSGENNYNNLSRHYDASVIVNATPVGMYPHTQDSPIDLTPFTKLEGVLDVIYNPSKTALLQQAEQLGLVAENGLLMLVAQAKESAEWFSGHSIQDELIPSIYQTLEKQMRNIVLIGMPGCGKSSVGKLLAECLGKKFIDADEQIVLTAQKSIPEIFAADGEDGFRKIETEVLANIGKSSGTVIATGGGCVTRPENYFHLHQNSMIIWLKRDIHQLPVDGRPLSQSGMLTQMYETRKPLYERFSDLQIENNGTPEETVDKILSLLKLEA